MQIVGHLDELNRQLVLHCFSCTCMSVFLQQPDLTRVDAKSRMLEGYFKISRHYKWALTQVFDVMKYNAVVLVEGESLKTDYNIQ